MHVGKKNIHENLVSEQSRLLANFRIERKKFYPGPGFEPRSLALQASALTTKPYRTSTDP